MGYDPAAAKRAVTMSLNDELVRRARRVTGNLSETVEALLAGYVDQAESQAARVDQQVVDYVRASDAFTAEHGSLADEFPTLWCRTKSTSMSNPGRRARSCRSR